MIKRTLFVLWMWACFALAAFGQSTTVSGQVTDAGGQAWNSGTYSFGFYPNPQYPASTYTWTGGAFNSQAPIAGSLSGTGGYSVSVPTNSAITPVGSKWILTVCPQATTTTCFSTPATIITGATQSLNVTPPALVIPATPGVTPTAYADSEISGAVVGSTYYNSTLLTSRICIALPCSLNWQGGSGAALAGNANAFYLSPACPVPASGNCYHINATGAQDCTTGAWTTSSSTITLGTSPSRPFRPSDVGTLAYGFNLTCGAVGASQPANSITLTTIATYISPTQVTLTVAPNANCTPTGLGGCTFVWGDSDEQAALNAWFQAITANNTCGNTGVLPAGLIFTSLPIISSTDTCGNDEVVQATGSNFTILGQGFGSSIIVPLPTFNSATCPTSTANACIFGVGGSANDSQGTQLENFTVNGFGSSPQNVPASGACALSISAFGFANTVGVLNFMGPGSGHFSGFCSGGIDGTPTFLQNVVVAASGGNSACNFGAWTVAYQPYCAGGANNNLLQMSGSGNVITYGGFIGYNVAGTQNIGFSGTGVTWYDYGSRLEAPHAGQSIVSVSASNTAHLIGTSISDGAVGSSSTGLSCAGTCYLNNVTVNMPTATNTGIKVVSGGKLFQDGETIINAPTAFTNAGTAMSATKESGTVSCTTSAATITFLGTYYANPIVVIQDLTTAGVVTKTSEGLTTQVVGCPGASDVLNYTVTPNPF